MKLNRTPGLAAVRPVALILLLVTFNAASGQSDNGRRVVGTASSIFLIAAASTISLGSRSRSAAA